MKAVNERKIGIIMNGVTGRMGTNQHLLRSIVPIIKQGGVKIGENEYLVPDPILVGRSAAKLEKLAEQAGVSRWTTDLDAALADPYNEIYFDAQTTPQRVEGVAKGIAAQKHIYCEKPTAMNVKDALELHHKAEKAGIIHGVVQDKLWLPGFLKLKTLRDQDFFGKILSVRGEFGYWVFEGDTVAQQRPSWNYRKEDGGGMIFDMFCHWRYVLDNLFGEVKSVSCLGATHIEKRWDEQGKPYTCTADDAAYGTFELEGGIIAQFNSSWCVRPRRDDLLTVHVDGTKGSAVATLRTCFAQPHGVTPRCVWNPDIDSPVNHFTNWQEVPNTAVYDNAFKVQWEMFLKSVALMQPFAWNLLVGAKGVQLAEAGLESWQKRSWVSIPEIK
jgi:predicted dehydrogenase